MLVRILCTFLGWHRPQHSKWFDGCSVRATCVRCGQGLMQDSQGNWF